MSGVTYSSGTTRRRVLAGLAATLGTATAVERAGATSAIDVDADNLVAGNDRLTVTLDGVQGGEIQDATVTLGGIAFATVEVLATDPAVLAVDPSNVIENETIAGQDSVEVVVWIKASSGEFAGADESQVITE